MPKIRIITIAVLFVSLNLSTAYAMQQLEDEHMGTVTGQDGLTITLTNTNITADRFVWIDKDGLQPLHGNTYGILTPEKGVVSFGGEGSQFRLIGDATIIKLDADANQGAPFVNINIQLPDNFEVETGNIYVADRDNLGVITNQTKILDSMIMSLSGLEMNLQLGNSPQGEFIKIYGRINEGIKISNLGLLINSGNAYGIGISEMLVKDSGLGNNDLTFNGLGVSVTSNGLMINPSVGKTIDIGMSEFTFGGLASSNVVAPIGDVFVSGLVLGGNTIRIIGH